MLRQTLCNTPSVNAPAIEVANLTKTLQGARLRSRASASRSKPVPCSACSVRNGAGKTTTINILSTLIRPTSGSATVNGFDVVRRPAQVRSSIGMVGQFHAVDPLMNGRENLVLFGGFSGLRRRQAKIRADELLEQFSLVDAADRRLTTYPVACCGGSIRVRPVVPPKVLILDEPTTG